MYVCICKAVTDGQIREAVRQGCCTQKELVRCLNVGRDCGKCRSEVRELLQDLTCDNTFQCAANGPIPVPVFPVLAQAS